MRTAAAARAPARRQPEASPNKKRARAGQATLTRLTRVPLLPPLPLAARRCPKLKTQKAKTQKAAPSPPQEGECSTTAAAAAASSAQERDSSSPGSCENEGWVEVGAQGAARARGHRAPLRAWAQLALLLSTCAAVMLHSSSQRTLRELDVRAKLAAEQVAEQARAECAAAALELPVGLGAAEEVTAHLRNAATSLQLAAEPAARALIEAGDVVRARLPFHLQASKECITNSALALAGQQKTAGADASNTQACDAARTLAVSALLGTSGWLVGVPFLPGLLDNVVMATAGFLWPILSAARDAGEHVRDEAAHKFD